MNISTMTAVKAKTHFGEFIDTAQREPVIVTKKNRPVGVFFSIQDIKDTAWGEKALQAHAEGYIGTEQSMNLLNKLANASD